MIDWFRSWHGAPTDNKWLVIARKAGVVPGIVSAIVWALFDYASQNDARGSIDGFDVETYSAFSGFNENDVEAVISALSDKGLVADKVFKSWEKRQPKREDSGAAERKRKQRDQDNVTQCHAVSQDVTTEKSREDKEQKEEKDKPNGLSKKSLKPALEKPADVSDQVWDDFTAIRKAKKAPLTATALSRIRQEAGKLDWGLEKALATACARGWQGFEAKWIEKDQENQNVPRRPSQTERIADGAARLLERFELEERGQIAPLANPFRLGQ